MKQTKEQYQESRYFELLEKGLSRKEAFEYCVEEFRENRISTEIEEENKRV